MVRVLYVVSTLQRTGPISFLYNLIQAFDKKSIHPVILTLSVETDTFPSLKGDFETLGIEIISLGLSRIKGIFLAKTMIKNLVDAKSIDVIHTIGYRADAIINQNVFRKQLLVSSIQSNIFDDYPMLYGKLKGGLLAKSHINKLKGKVAVSCSSFVAESIKLISGIDSQIVYNSVSKNIYHIASDEDKKLARQNLELPVNAKIFILAGFLILRKDPITAIKGFIEAGISNSILVILGDGPLLEECIKEVGTHKNIFFKGYVSNVIEYLKSADFYISSSLSEGLPLSVLEAFACGLPSILSDIKPHDELTRLLDNRSYNRTFKTKNYLELADVIKQFNKQDYQMLSQAFRQIIDDKVNSDIMANKFLNIYKGQEN